ncbi:MAG: hypothetical protein KUG77_23175 [Nannocystaceae bacterium]|nr:hypothetical protein [Nannocystaceae bacterium]
MKLRKFKAESMRQALARVKEELGPDALIIATKPVKGPGGKRMLAVTAAVDEGEGESRSSGSSSSVSTLAARADSAAELAEAMLPLRSELRALRSLVRNTRPTKNVNNKALLEEVAELKRMVSSMSRRPKVDVEALEQASAGSTTALKAEGRIRVLIGPTGVGKTTTIAKIAANAALLERKRVHIISLDNHRVGAPAQIKAFAKMMGVPVTLVRHAPTELPEALEQSANAELVLVDTAGRSLRDLRAPRMLEQLINRLPRPEIHLAMAAGTSAFDIDTIIARYAPIGVSRLLFTKVDETADLRELVLTPARHNIPVGYVTRGQKVPEDIQVATRKLLMSMAIEGQEFMEVA